MRFKYIGPQFKRELDRTEGEIVKEKTQIIVNIL